MREAKKELLFYLKSLKTDKLTPGTSGNISLREKESGHILISPSGIDYDDIRLEDIVTVDTSGNVIDGTKAPSSELDLHLAIYAKRNDCFGVVHTHSPFATTLACMGKEIPPVHYMIAYSGHKVPVANYYPFGSKELAEEVQHKISEYQAILLENHGLLACGETLKYAYHCAINIEFVAQVYCQCLSIGDFKLLTHDQMSEVIEKFKSYGQK